MVRAKVDQALATVLTDKLNDFEAIAAHARKRAAF